MFELFGWLGSALLACCGLPEAIKSLREKQSGLTWGLLLMWFIGEIFLMVYAIHLGSIPLFCNYTANVFILLPVLWYKMYPSPPQK
jgi:uncharacterized protein with PQ loop repeat